MGKFLKTVTYQEIDNDESSAELGRICGRASRLENFEGHARSADVRAAKYGGDVLALDRPSVHRRRGCVGGPPLALPGFGAEKEACGEWGQ